MLSVIILILVLVGASMIDEAVQSFKNESYFKFGFFGILCIPAFLKL